MNTYLSPYNFLKISLGFHLKCCLCFLTFLLSFTAVSGQIDFENLKFVTIKEGMSKKPISAILQDDQGFLWIGTRGSGLYRYDGVNYESYKHIWGDSSSINSNQIITLFLDNKNNLWAGTDAGLNLFDREQKAFKSFKQIPNHNGGYYTVSSLIQYDNEHLIIGTYASGLFKINTSDYSISKINISLSSSNKDLYVNALELGLNGEFYAGTSLGLMKYDPESAMLEQYHNAAISPASLQMTKNSIESLYRDETDHLWIGTWNLGLLKIGLKEGETSFKSFPVTKEKVFCLIKYKDNMLLGTENDGLYIIKDNGDVDFHYTANSSYKESIKSNSIWSIFLDNKERIWLGHYNQGVEVYNPLHTKFGSIDALLNETNGIASNPTTGIIVDKEGILRISTFNGVYTYDPTTRDFEDFNSTNTYETGFKSNIGIESLFLDSNNNFWIGTWDDGIYLLKDGSRKFINYNKATTKGALKTNTIRGFAEDSKGRIWIASFLSGLHYYDPNDNKFYHCDNTSFKSSGLTQSDVKTILVDSYDNIWVGSTNGLYKIEDLGNLNFQAKNMRPKMELVQKNHPSLHSILSLYEATDSSIWIGTEGVGLFRYDQNEDTFYNQNLLQDIKEMTVNGITEDLQNNLWICGDLGVTKLDFKTNSVTNFTKQDGLLSHYFRNSVITTAPSGTLYFGSELGVNYIDPQNYKTNKNEPLLHLTDFKLFNKSVLPNENGGLLKKNISQTDTIELKYDQNFFSIEYVGINYTRAEKNEYAYFLKGFDVQWNYVGHSKSATYTGLRPGNYVFNVKASNNDGVWNKEPLQLYINVTPAWWKSTIAYVSYVFLGFLLCLGIYRLSKRRFKEKQDVLLERNRRKQEKELHRVKLQFFTNISHEFRTPLTLIINPINDLIKNDKKNLPKRVNEKLKIIHKNSYRLSILINELMDFRKLQSNKLQIIPEEIEVVETLKNIKAFFKEEKKKRGIRLKFNSPHKALRAWVDPGMFEKIIFNILSNAFKVTPDGGEIKITLEKNESKDSQLLQKNPCVFVISIRDSGSGIDQKEYKKIFKRFYQVSTDNKNYYGSTGIGLEMVKDYMALHNGTIDIESKIGEGAKFILTFPLEKPSSFQTNVIKNNGNKREPEIIEISNQQVNTADTPTFASKELPSKKEYTVLIVEDNIELLEYVKKELSGIYHTLVAPNGKLGYETALKKQPDIIITDVVMPLLNGIELCNKIKTNIATSHIPIIILTSKTMIEDRIWGVNSGADGYLSKPFDMGLLKAMINQMILSRKLLLDKFTQKEDLAEPQSKIALTSLDDAFLKRVVYLIQENIEDQNLNVESLAEQLRLSRSQLYRKIKVLTGHSASEFLRKVRLEKARELLQSQNNYNVSEVTYKVGFSSPSYFTKCFKKEFGYLPTREEIQINDTEKS